MPKRLSREIKKRILEVISHTFLKIHVSLQGDHLPTLMLLS